MKRVALLVTMPHASDRASIASSSASTSANSVESHAQRGRVMREERVAQFRVPGFARCNRQADTEQAARTVRRVRAQLRKRQRRHAAVRADAIQRGGEVGRRVRERAVEVEQDRVDRQRGGASTAPQRGRVRHRQGAGTPSDS